MFKNGYICDRQTKHKSNFNLNKTKYEKTDWINSMYAAIRFKFSASTDC